MAHRRGVNATPRPTTTTAATTVVKWRGGNVTNRPGNTSWADFWGASWDLSWVTTQIDRAAYLGCNAIRIIGGVNGIADGSYSRATYLARQTLVMDYCAALNIAYYPCGAGDYSTPLTADMQTELVALATFLVGAPGIVGLDILQEYQGVAGQKGIATATLITNNLTPWYNAIKAANPALQCTFSDNHDSSDVTAIVDYFDYHMYLDTPIGWLATTTKRFIIGEFGQNQAATSGQRVSRYNGVASANRYIKSNGAFCWALADQSTSDASNKWGVFDNSGVERTDMTAVFTDAAKFPKTRTT